MLLATIATMSSTGCDSASPLNAAIITYCPRPSSSCSSTAPTA